METPCRAGLLALLPLWAAAAPPGYSIGKPALDSSIMAHASSRTAGAIDSIKFRGHEFVNAHDHGREWQSAVSFDGLGECLNPTQAGSDKDGEGPDSSSELISARASAPGAASATLFTSARMAYWLQPGEPYKGACGSRGDIHSAQNQSVLSDDTVFQQVSIGYGSLPNVLDFLITLNIAAPHNSAVFEALTGYMPPDFSLFLTFDPATSQVAPLSAGPGEQRLPVILATKDRRFAAGVYAPALPQKEFPALGYGRFAFPQRPASPGWNTMKWNAVFRLGPVKPGPLVVHCFVALGTVDEVRAALSQLASGNSR